MLDSSEDVASFDDSGAKMLTNGSLSGGAKGFTLDELSTAATHCTNEG